MPNQLSPENEQFLDRAVSAGMYDDREAAIEEAVSLLRRREKLIEDVNRGIEQIERGETFPFDLTELKSALQQRLQAG